MSFQKKGFRWPIAIKQLARDMFVIDGMYLPEIAKTSGVPEATLEKWRDTQEWVGQKEAHAARLAAASDDQVEEHLKRERSKFLRRQVKTVNRLNDHVDQIVEDGTALDPDSLQKVASANAKVVATGVKVFGIRDDKTVKPGGIINVNVLVAATSQRESSGPKIVSGTVNGATSESTARSHPSVPSVHIEKPSLE